MHATISFLLVLLPAAVLGEGKFSYDLEAEDGPLKWADLDIENNKCGGMAQSGINVPTGPCDEVMADYVFNVSSYKWFYLCPHSFIFRVVLYWLHRY
jgi:carbonic anhydrase